MPKFTQADIEIAAKDRTQQGIASAKKGIGGLTRMIRSYGAEIGAVVGAVYGAIRITKNFTDAFIKQEEAVTRLNTSLETTGVFTPELSEEIQDLASELQGMTMYGDEATLQATSLLQSLGKLSGEGLKQAIPLVQDLATGMDMDLNTAASLVGKTLGSTTNALSRYGIMLDSTASPSEKLAELSRQIEKSFGGISEAMGNTFQGRVTKVKNAFGDLKEVIGGILAENAKPFMDWLLDFLQNSKNIEIIARIVRGLGATFGTVFGFLIETIKSIIGYYKIWINASRQLGNILETIFNPKKWGTGELKKEMRDLKDFTVQTAIDVAKGWEEYALKTYDKWKRVFGDEVMPEIQTFTNNYQLEMGKINEATDDAKDNTIEWMWDFEALREGHIEAVRSMIEIQTRHNEAIAQGSTNLEAYSQSLGLLSEQMVNHGTVQEKLNQYQKEQNALQQKASQIASQFVTPAFAELESAVKNVGEAFKNFITTAIANLLRALGEKLSIMATLYAISLQFGKAAAAAAGAAAAFVAAGAIKSLAQGGEFVTNGPELMLVGDNPSGRERVRVEPLDRGGGMNEMPLIANIYLGTKKIHTEITKAIRNKEIPIYRGALVNT